MNPILCIPAFDEAGTVGDVVRGACAHGHVVLVVDDGSTDDTAAVAATAGAEILRHPVRLGKAQALRTGIAAARVRGASHVVTLDADGQHDPADVAALLAAAGPRTVVVGSRLGDSAALGPGRREAAEIAAFFVNWVSGLRLQDSQSGFRVYPLALFDAVTTRCGGFVFETEILLAAAAHGFPVREVAIGVRPRVGTRSRFRPVVDGGAITGLLLARGLARLVVESGAAAAELASVLDADRRRQRHAAILAAAAPFAGSAAWGLAVGAAAAQRAGGRVSRWWHHPRLRRAVATVAAAAALPVVLPLVVARAAAGRDRAGMRPLTSALVSALYTQERLGPVTAPGPATVETLAARN